MPSSTPQHGQHASRSPGTIPLSERQQMALLSRMTEEQKQHHSHVSVNKHGETPLHIAAKQGSESEVQELLSKGVDPNCPDAAGWTPLHEACIRGRYDIAKTLILAGADANAKGYQGFTPLHDAAANGHAELINLLLDFGADDTQRNHKGQAPVDVAPEPIKIIFKNRASDKPSSSEASSSSSGAPTSSISTRNSVMRRLPPTNKESSGSGPSSLNNTPPASPGPRVTLRLNQAHLKSSAQHRGGGNEESHHLGKKCKINLASTSGAYSSVEPSDGGSDAPSSSSKIKMENMEEILLKENTSAIETNPSQDETKDPLADTESVISPAGSAASTPHHDGKSGGGGSDKEGGERGEKRGATDNNMSSDEESKKKKRKEDNTGPGVRSKASSVSEGSPKIPSGGGHDSEPDEGGGNTHQESSLGGSGGGPKVPPLKIVLPSAGESDLSTGGSGRNGKSGTARHSALPYVVASDPAGDTAGSAPASPSMASSEPASTSETPATIKVEIKQEPMTEEQRTTQRILRSSHSRGSSSSSPAAPDASPSTVTVNTPPSSAVPSPGVPDITIKTEPLSSSQSNPPSSQNNPPPSATVDEKPTLPLSSEDPPAPAPTEPPSQPQHELHPRKRKLKHARADSTWNTSSMSSSVTSSTTSATTATSGTNSVTATPSGDVKEVKEESVVTGQPTSTDQPFTNCYQLYLNIRKQIDLRRKGLFPVKPITPTKFARYLMVTCDYVLANNNSSRHNVPKYEPPSILPSVMKDMFTLQEQERYKLRMQHVVEKEKFALGVEQEILRVHCHAARELANQPLPYSACTILKDEEVYNLIGPDTDDKDSIEHKKDKRTDRYRYNGRLFIKWLRDIDDKWDKIKKRMIIRQTNEAESLHAVQKMDWDWKIRELSLEVPPPGEESYVPMISIVDDLQSTDELAS